MVDRAVVMKINIFLLAFKAILISKFRVNNADYNAKTRNGFILEQISACLQRCNCVISGSEDSRCGLLVHPRLNYCRLHHNFHRW